MGTRAAIRSRQEQALLLKERGLTADAIAAALGVSVATIYIDLSGDRAALRPRCSRNPEYLQQVRDALAAGASPSELARQLGVSRQSLYQLVNYHVA